MKSWKALDFKGLTPEKQDPLFNECTESAKNLEGLVKEKILSRSEYEIILVVINPYVTTYAYQTGGPAPTFTPDEILKGRIEGARECVFHLKSNMHFFRSLAEQDACIEFVYDRFLDNFANFYLIHLQSLNKENFKYWDNETEKQEFDTIIKEAGDLNFIISDRYFAQPKNMKK